MHVTRDERLGGNEGNRRVDLRFPWLSDTHENSNYILLRIPIEIHRLQRGQRLICMDSERLPDEPGLGEMEIESLHQAGLVWPWLQNPSPEVPIEYEALQHTYRRMLADGSFASQADLARHLGVSRVWVSRVLKGGNRKAN